MRKRARPTQVSCRYCRGDFRDCFDGKYALGCFYPFLTLIGRIRRALGLPIGEESR